MKNTDKRWHEGYTFDNHPARFTLALLYDPNEDRITGVNVDKLEWMNSLGEWIEFRVADCKLTDCVCDDFLDNDCEIERALEWIHGREFDGRFRRTA